MDVAINWDRYTELLAYNNTSASLSLDPEYLAPDKPVHPQLSLRPSRLSLP
jgi:hypothetical protein